MTQIIRVTWHAGSTDADGLDTVGQHLSGVQGSGDRLTCAGYRLTGSDRMDRISDRIPRTGDPGVPPTWLTVIELPDLSTAIDCEDAFVAREQGIDAGHAVVARGLYAVVDDVHGPAHGQRPGLGRAVQVGSFDCTSVAAEWEVARWYATLRMPDMAAMPGAVRARRLCSVAGPTKFGVLYEFDSLEARVEGFEPEDLRAFEAGHPNSVLVDAVVHRGFSPSIGELVWPIAPAVDGVVSTQREG